MTPRELDAVAEKGGFEPPRPAFWTCTLSRGVHSTSLPLLRSNFVARLAGFEPTTLWFVARYSIQLSYSRAKEN